MNNTPQDFLPDEVYDQLEESDMAISEDERYIVDRTTGEEYHLDDYDYLEEDEY